MNDVQCNKCMDTGWRLLPTINPVDALPCDRCPRGENPESDFQKVLAAHGLYPDDDQ